MSIYYINEKLNRIAELINDLSDTLWSEDGVIPLGGSKERLRDVLNNLREEINDIEGTID